MTNANAGRRPRPDRSNGVILPPEENAKTIAEWQAAMDAVRAEYLMVPYRTGREMHQAAERRCRLVETSRR